MVATTGLEWTVAGPLVEMVEAVAWKLEPAGADVCLVDVAWGVEVHLRELVVEVAVAD